MVQMPSLTFSLVPITHYSHFCCMPAINFSIVVKIKNGLIEIGGGNHKYISVFYVKSSGTCHIISTKSLRNPGLPGGQGFAPMQHRILAHPVPFPPASTSTIILLPPLCPWCPVKGSLDPELMPVKTRPGNSSNC